MLALVILLVLVIAVYLSGKNERNAFRRQGIKVTGLVVDVGETNASDYYRLGGNIYQPTVQFTTIDGKEIIGKLVIGFTTQGQLPPTFYVNVYYMAANPYRFYIEI